MSLGSLSLRVAFRRTLVALSGLALLSLTGAAVAGPHEGHAADAHAADVAGEEADAAAHDAHGGHHVPHWSDVNWASGVLGEKDGVEPSLLYRPTGMPIPVLALVFNSLVLFTILIKVGAPAVRSGLTSRRARVAGDIDAAAKMVDEATRQLAHYEGKLAEMDREMDRIKREMKEQAEAERARILEEAKARQVEMERDAEHLIQQELAEARQQMTLAAVGVVMDRAAKKIAASLGDADHQRLADALVGALGAELRASGFSTKGAGA